MAQKQTEPKVKKKRGFACLDPERQRAIASRGGKAAHAAGTAHEFTPEEAAAAGRKGGQSNVNRHRFTSETGRAAGRKGGRGNKKVA